MPDIIQLLPDNIANQIAAGEVIQRPASAVKELLENAVDAGATEVRLFVNDAGKALVQVTDNGSGMSETDARMCFERHATSKILTIEDLFHIRTMGFRGEALASIAAVAQVELKTKRAEDETGTYLEIDNSVVKKQEPVDIIIMVRKPADLFRYSLSAPTRPPHNTASSKRMSISFSIIFYFTCSVFNWPKGKELL